MATVAPTARTPGRRVSFLVSRGRVRSCGNALVLSGNGEGLQLQVGGGGGGKEGGERGLGAPGRRDGAEGQAPDQTEKDGDGHQGAGARSQGSTRPVPGELEGTHTRPDPGPCISPRGLVVRPASGMSAILRSRFGRRQGTNWRAWR